MSCSSCHTSPCNCSNKSSCQIIISDDVKYTGDNFTCENDPTIVLTKNTKLSAILLLIFQKLCSLYNSITALGTTVSTMVEGHIIEDEGVPLAQRDTINFVGSAVSVTDSGGKTVVTINTGVGTAGPEGISYRQGVGVPSPSLGNDGDTYTDLASPNLDIYTKAAGVWTDTTLDLKGVTGSAGANGTNGTNGTNGINGLNFYQGASDPTAPLGFDDESFLNSVSGDLFKKVAGAWVLQGNIYTGSIVLLDGLFQAERSTDILFVTTATQYVPFNITTNPGNYNYGTRWLTNEWTSPDTKVVKVKGEFQITCDGTGAAAFQNLTVDVYKNDVLDHSVIIGSMNMSTVATSTFIWQGSNVAVGANDRINIRLNAGANNSLFTLKADSTLFNEYN